MTNKTLKTTRNLVFISITESQLSTWPKTVLISNIVYLILRKNLITNIGSLKMDFWIFIQYLDVSSNPLHIFIFYDSMNNLMYLDLSFTKISAFKKKEFQKMKNLKVFKFTNCFNH